MSTRNVTGFLLIFMAMAMAGCAGQVEGDEAEIVDAAEGEAIDVAEEELYEAFPPGAPQRCIDIRRVSRIEPIGNHTLLFHMRGGDVWRNRLPRPCPGVRPSSRFLYEPRSGRLCSMDIVYELVDEGFGFRRGAGCPLGEFDFLTEEQAEALKDLR